MSEPIETPQESEKLHAVAKRVGRGRRGNAREADIHERAAEMERSRLSDPCSVCGWIRGEHGAAGLAWEDKCPRKDGGKWTGWLDTHFTPAQPQPHTAGKPTAGPFRVGEVMHTSQRAFNDPADLHWPIFDPTCGCVAHVFTKADADLFSEAGTVYHKTGLTPRQLAEERARLQARIDAAHVAIGHSPKQDCDLAEVVSALEMRRVNTAAQLADALAALLEAERLDDDPRQFQRDLGFDEWVSERRAAKLNARAILAKGGPNG